MEDGHEGAESGQEAIAAVPEQGGYGWDCGHNTGNGDKRLHWGCILVIEPTGLTDKLGVECEEKRNHG